MASELGRRPKSELVADYIRRFQQVTRGGLYVDGFAAPQRRNAPEAWSARRVLEVEPKRIRGFWLFDIDPGGVEMLRELKSLHHRSPISRKVRVFEGDFNKEVFHFLQAKELRRDTAVFALLDQRATECHCGRLNFWPGDGGAGLKSRSCISVRLHGSIG
ncbi:three-Cys-motif partner protein TcmP [Paracoccus sp. 22332]|uniref:three-Cys-motif partner protein TcmP n=1 Tax=Paracoccus sp. 22332 TaxID=3453913 RepID=UPI003F8497CC